LFAEAANIFVIVDNPPDGKGHIAKNSTALRILNC